MSIFVNTWKDCTINKNYILLIQHSKKIIIIDKQQKKCQIAIKSVSISKQFLLKHINPLINLQVNV